MFFRRNNALLLAGTKFKSTYKSLEVTTATRLPTVIRHTPTNSTTSYKDDDQTSITTRHWINQPCSESAKFDIKSVDKRVEASCKKAYWCNIFDIRLFIAVAKITIAIHMP